MGFDLYGVNPDGGIKTFPEDFKNKKAMDEYFKWQQETEGAYFRNNVWWWRPLWTYVAKVCHDILNEEDIENGFSNSGHLIDKDKSERVGLRLLHLYEQGKSKEYEVAYMKELNELPLIKCDLCKGTGVRKDMKVNNGCNKCSGKGKVQQWQTMYPFEADNVKEFSRFCLKSGGFEIS